MAASNGSPLRQPGVPAWKRLGLKLKYAKEDTGSHSLQDSNPAVASGRPIGDDTAKQNSNDNVRPPKKRRISPDTPHEPQYSAANRVWGDSPMRLQGAVDTRASEHRAESLVETRDHESQTVNDSPATYTTSQKREPVEDRNPETRRKSVTFTTDTKQEDGFSACAFFDQWSTDQDSGQDHPTPLVSPPPSKKAKKQQKRAERTETLAEPSSQNSHTIGYHDQTSSESVPGYVAYLQLFHTDRRSWKFNKKKQKEVLKNLFYIDRIPPEHNEAILQYIAGLQGAGARQRIIESATAVLKQIAEKTSDGVLDLDMESEEARRTAYSAALQRHLERYEQAKVRRDEYDDQQIEEMRREAEKGRRADALLGELLRKELYPDQVLPAATEPVQSSTPDSGANTKSQDTATNGSTSTSTSTSKRKKRKARTEASSDDSSSDTSEGEANFNPKRGPATVHDALSASADFKVSNSPKQQAPPKPTGTKKIFDDDFPDQIIPKKRTYDDTAPKRRPGEKPKARGFAYTHGTRADESGSEDE